MHRPYHQSQRRRVPVALITAAEGVCHPTSAALMISRCSIYPDRSRAWSQMNENNNRDREIGPVQSATALSDCGRAGLVAATGGDSTGVSQTDAGQPWAAAAAAWLVIHGAAAGTRRESQWMSSAWRRRRGAWSISWSDACRPTVPAACHDN